MDLGIAERLAGSMDPKGLTSLQNRNNDPAVAHAVAEQFGAYLMQGLMQNADGSAISMADGTGSAPVSSMFASAISRVAMSGDKLGLADMIYQSIAAKQNAASKTAPGATDANPPAAMTGTSPTATAAAAIAAAVTPTVTAATPSATAVPDPAPAPAAANGAAALHPEPHNFSLSPYRQGNGARPLGAPIGRTNLPPIPPTAPSGAANNPTAALVAAAKSAAAITSAAAAAAPATASATPPAAASVQAATVATQNWVMKTITVPRFGQVQLPIDGPASMRPAATGTATDASVSTLTRPPVFTHFLPISSIPRNYGLPWSHGLSAGAPANDVSPSAQNSSADAASFAQDLGPSLQQAAAKLGVSPRILLAQAALETGWGHSVVGNNVFGVKAGGSWQGASVNARTHEMVGGQMVAQDSSFRAYSSMAQSVTDFATMLSTSGRYKGALGAGNDVAAYARGLDAGGYASDKDYAAKLAAIANSPTMAAAAAALDQLALGQPGGTQG